MLCSTTVKQSLTEEHFSLKRESQIFVWAPQNQRAKPSHLFALMFHNHTERNPSSKMKRFLFLSPFFLMSVSFDWKTAHSCAPDMLDPDGNNCMHIVKFLKGTWEDAFVYKYPPVQISVLFFYSSRLIKTRVIIKYVCVSMCTIV